MGLRNAPWRRLLGARAGIAGASATGPLRGPVQRSSEEEETVDVNS
jgi:hypothetical protein